MATSKHPDFNLETTFLAKVSKIRAKLMGFLESDNAASVGIDRHSQRALRDTYDRRLRGITPADEATVIGKVIDQNGRITYIGLEAVRDPEDPSGSYLVARDSWESEYGRQFHEATPQNPRGLRSKRTFLYSRNHRGRPSDRLVDIKEETFDEAPRLTTRQSEGEVLSDALLESLEASRTGEMSQIVPTITREQSQTLRSEQDQLLVVQGGPGTGKTAVLLHRISWLLANGRKGIMRERIEEHDILMIGPNRVFLRYIEAVLPSLGRQQVQQIEISKLSKFHGLVNTSEESEPVQLLKGSSAMSELIEKAVEANIRVMQDDLAWQYGGRSATIPAESVIGKLNQWSNDPYMERRRKLRIWLLEQAEVAGRASGTGFDDLARKATEKIIPGLSARQLLGKLFSDRQLLGTVGREVISDEQIELLLHSSPGRKGKDSWTTADIPLLDFADSLISAEAPRRYEHIVVDEAQDLSPMELRMIRTRSANGSITIAGDVAQSTGLFSRSNWDEVVEILQKKWPVNVRELKYCYRVPQQILSLAHPYFLRIQANCSFPEGVRRGPFDPEYVTVRDSGALSFKAWDVASKTLAEGLSVGLIVSSKHYEIIRYDWARQGRPFNEVSSGSIEPTINLMTPIQAKGLEFDAVIIVEPTGIATSENGDQQMYIAVTRATQKMTWISSQRA